MRKIGYAIDGAKRTGNPGGTLSSHYSQKRRRFPCIEATVCCSKPNIRAAYLIGPCRATSIRSCWWPVAKCSSGATHKILMVLRRQALHLQPWTRHVPETPPENVGALVDLVRGYRAT
jgi:hypothetical protein